MSRILLADDSPHAQRMGERILGDEGYEVVSVTDGETAVLRLDDVDPDVILADVFLPGRSGVEICRYVKGNARHRHARVILTAGLLETFDEAEARAAGADAIIKKPFEASVVLDTVRPLAVEAHLSRGMFEQQPAVATEAALGPSPAVAAAAEPKRVQSPEEVAAEIPVLAKPLAATAVSDEERIRAAVTVALDSAFTSLVDEITARVLNAKPPTTS